MTEQTNEMTWKDWTREDWDNANYCKNCGLPLLEVKADENAGGYVCVYCEWTSDEASALQTVIDEQEKTITEQDKQWLRVESALSAMLVRHGWGIDGTNPKECDCGACKNARALLASTAPKDGQS